MRRGIHLITDQVEQALPELRQVQVGLLHVFIQHTSASLTINENADPDVTRDLEASLNRIAPGYTECVTDSWCLSSRDDGWLLSLLQIAFLILVVVAAWLAFAWAIRMLASPRRHWWFLLFFAALGLAGIAAWIATVPRAQWGSFAHIPAIGALCVALGLLMYFGFRPRPRRPRRGKSN